MLVFHIDGILPIALGSSKYTRHPHQQVYNGLEISPVKSQGSSL